MLRSVSFFVAVTAGLAFWAEASGPDASSPSMAKISDAQFTAPFAPHTPEAEAVRAGLSAQLSDAVDGELRDLVVTASNETWRLRARVVMEPGAPSQSLVARATFDCDVAGVSHACWRVEDVRINGALID